jgi:hypothetical protein
MSPDDRLLEPSVLSGDANMADIPWHLLGLAYGVSAAIVTFAIFYLCGLAISPAGRDGASGEAPAFDASPAVLGAAIYVLLCWFGIRLKIPVTTVIVAFAVLTAVLAAVRVRTVSAGLRARDVVSREAAGWYLAFALLYALGYVFFTPSVSGEFLPPRDT